MKNKRVLSLLLAVMILLSSLPFAGVTAFAAKSGDYEYQLLKDGTAEITEYTGSATTLSIPSKIGGYTVTSIGTYAFYDCDRLTNVTIPSSITNLGYCAFNSCDKLKNITVHDGITSIGSDAFAYTAFYNDKSNWDNDALYLGKYLLVADNYTVSGAYSVKNGTVLIANSAFYNCHITSIEIPNSIKYIGSGAFYNCYLLSSVEIPKGVISIGAGAFSYCSALQSITIAEGVTAIEDNTFRNCHSLTSINIPDGVTSIGNTAFYNCTNLLNITITDDVSYIGSSAFEDTLYYNTDANWKNGALYIGNNLVATDDYKMNGFGIVENGTVTIADGAFAYFERLQSVTIPDSVKYINSNAFYECENLASVFYGGSKAQWNKIIIGKGNQELLHATMHYNYDINSTLATPKIKSVSNTYLGVRIIWNEVSGAAYYGVFRKTGNGSWENLGVTDSTDVIDISVDSGKKYTYTIRCVASDGKTYQSAYDTTGKSITFIDAPFITQVSNTATGMQIKWDKVNGAAKYRVFYKANNESTWHKAGDTTSTKYTWTKAKSGTNYTFTVRCITSDGKSYTSDYDPYGLGLKYIAAPKLSSVSNTATGVKISWGKVTGAAKYRVFYKANGESTWHKAGDTTSTSFTWTKAKSGTKYTFTVRCISKDGKSFTSGYDSKGKTITFLSAPKISSLSKTSSGIQIKWGKVTGAVNYKVFRKTAGGSWQAIGTTTSTSFVDKTAKKGTKYTYTVRCVSKDGKTYTSGYDSTGKSITR